MSKTRCGWLLMLCTFVMGTLWLAVGAHAGVVTPVSQRVVLNNGVTLLLMERHDVPLISFQAVVRGGVLSELPSRAGAASLLTDLLMKGAGTRNAQQFAEAIESSGGVIVTRAGTEAVQVEGHFLARDQALMIELLSDLLQRPQLSMEEFERLRLRQIEFLRAAKDGDLKALLPLYADAALFGSHPYGHIVTGSETTLAGLPYAAVVDFYHQQMGADRLILAVSGDFNSARMQVLLRKAFSNWRRADAALTPLKPAAVVQGRRVLLIDAPQSVQSYFWLGNVGVARNDSQRATLDVVNTLYGGRFTSILNSELRIRTGLTYGAVSTFSQRSQPGSWSIGSFTRTATTVEAIDLALSTLQRLHQQGLSEAQLQSGKNYLLGQFPTAYETAAQWAAALVDRERYALPLDEVDTYAKRVAAVTLQDTRQVINRVYPDPQDLLLVVMGDAQQLRHQLDKYGPVTEMKLSDTAFAPSSP